VFGAACSAHSSLHCAKRPSYRDRAKCSCAQEFKRLLTRLPAYQICTPLALSSRTLLSHSPLPLTFRSPAAACVPQLIGLSLINDSIAATLSTHILVPLQRQYDRVAAACVKSVGRYVEDYLKAVRSVFFFADPALLTLFLRDVFASMEKKGRLPADEAMTKSFRRSCGGSEFDELEDWTGQDGEFVGLGRLDVREIYKTSEVSAFWAGARRSTRNSATRSQIAHSGATAGARRSLANSAFWRDSLTIAHNAAPRSQQAHLADSLLADSFVRAAAPFAHTCALR